MDLWKANECCSNVEIGDEDERQKLAIEAKLVQEELSKLRSPGSMEDIEMHLLCPELMPAYLVRLFCMILIKIF